MEFLSWLAGVFASIFIEKSVEKGIKSVSVKDFISDSVHTTKQLEQSLMNQPLYTVSYKVIETKDDIAIVDVFFPPEASATFSKITCDHLIAHARYSVSDIRERQDRWQNDLCSVTVGCAVNYPETFSETIEYEPHRFLKNGTLTDASLIAIKNFNDGKAVTLKFHSKHFRPFQKLTIKVNKS